MQLTTQINQDLLQQAMQLTGLNTEKEVLESALRLLIKQTPKLTEKNGILIIRSQETLDEKDYVNETREERMQKLENQIENTV